MVDCISFGPSEVNFGNVLKWCRHARDFRGSVQKKALTLVSHKCIQYIGKDSEFGSRYCFVCLPLDTKDVCSVDGKDLKKIPFKYDFNKSGECYKIFKEGDCFSCTCQGWETRNRRGELIQGGANCSHTLALFLAFKMRIFGRNEGNTEKLEQPDTLQGKVILN